MFINLIDVAKAAVVIPAAASSLCFVAEKSMVARADQQASHLSAPRGGSANGSIHWDDPNLKNQPSTKSLEAKSETSKEALASDRRVRIENILGALNRVAEVSMQMDPDRAAELEPVILDLAEQAMELSASEVVVKASTDAELTKIEDQVKELTIALAGSIEPEMTL